MSTSLPRLLPLTAKSALLAGILVSCWVVARGPLVAQERVAKAIVLDLAVTLPLAYLFLLRGTRVPRLTVLPVLGLGLAYAAWILPAGNVWLQTVRTWAVPALEVATLATLGWTLWRARRAYGALADDGYDLPERLRETLRRVFPSPRLGKVLAFELAVVHYALLAWRGRRPAAERFTYHRNNAAPVVLGAVMFLVLTELFGLHFLIAQWSPLAAWLLTASSAYFALQILAHFKAVLFRPVEIGATEIRLRCGLLGDARVPLAALERVELWTQPFPAAAGDLRIAPAGKLLGPNVCLRLREEVVWAGFYSLERRARAFYLQLDEPERFVSAVQARLAA